MALGTVGRVGQVVNCGHVQSTLISHAYNQNLYNTFQLCAIQTITILVPFLLIEN